MLYAPVKWILGLALLAYGALWQVESDGDVAQFALGSLLVVAAIGTIVGWRWKA